MKRTRILMSITVATILAAADAGSAAPELVSATESRPRPRPRHVRSAT